MKSFNEWMKNRLNESKDYTGYFVGRKLVCLDCGYRWENKDPKIGLDYDKYMNTLPPNMDEDPHIDFVECPKCQASHGSRKGVAWDPNDTSWREPDYWINNNYGPGGDPSDNQDF